MSILPQLLDCCVVFYLLLLWVPSCHLTEITRKFYGFGENCIRLTSLRAHQAQGTGHWSLVDH